MSSNDWWSSSSTINTPQRPAGPHHSHSYGQGNMSMSTSRSTRFVDELDPEDMKMAESIKFLPSFAASPAGKLALGTSPQSQGSSGANGTGSGGMNMSMGMGVGSPGDGRRSPTVNARFSASTQERDSPRHSRRSLLHNPSFNSSTNPVHSTSMAMDEDMPPTASLRDVSDSGPRPSEIHTPVELPTPQSLLPSSTTTSLHVFGPPTEVLATLQPYLAQFGTVQSYTPGPEGSNWYIVTYTAPLAASYALRRHGDIISGRWMIGFKVSNGDSTAGCTLVPGHNGDMAIRTGNPGAGTPMRINSNSAAIIKPKAAAQPVVKASSANNNEYGWDEPEQQGGWGTWVSQTLFGK
ncbi:hypothetical protein IAU60_004972 [Kwoniella sp. DSM 27419]